MESLPDQFLTNDDDVERENILPFNARSEQRPQYASDSRATAKPSSLSLVVAFIAIVLNIFVFVIAVDKPIDRLQSFFGGKTESALTKVESLQRTHAELQKLSVQHTTQLSTLNIAVQNVSAQLADYRNELMESNSRVSQLETRYKELKADIDLLNKPKPAAKPVVIEKTKAPEKPPVLVSLISIRIQGGTSWVSLREGSEVSPLLAIGDEWHSAKLLAADPIKKEAQLLLNGINTLVKL